MSEAADNEQNSFSLVLGSIVFAEIFNESWNFKAWAKYTFKMGLNFTDNLFYDSFDIS